MTTFTKLAQALAFLASNLDGQRYDVIAEACLEGGAARSLDGVASLGRAYQLHVIQILGQRHKEHDLRERYLGREFPDDRAEFKLGGHNEGHVHVDFRKGEDGWRLKKIWLCR